MKSTQTSTMGKSHLHQDSDSDSDTFLRLFQSESESSICVESTTSAFERSFHVEQEHEMHQKSSLGTWLLPCFSSESIPSCSDFFKDCVGDVGLDEVKECKDKDPFEQFLESRRHISLFQDEEEVEDEDEGCGKSKSEARVTFKTESRLAFIMNKIKKVRKARKDLKHKGYKVHYQNGGFEYEI